MKLEEHKKIWKIGVSKGDILVTLESILIQLVSNSSRTNELYALIGRFNTTNRAYDLGTVKYEDFNLELARIGMSVLELIDKITHIDFIQNEKQESDKVETLSREEIILLIESYLPKFHQIEKAPENRNLIENRILILSVQEGIYSLKSYFNQRNFKSVRFETWDNFGIHLLGEVDIVILNNMDLPFMPQQPEAIDEKTMRRVNIIRQAVESSNCYFVHYGSFFYLINEFTNRIIAANSIFTLYSRVKEMADFYNTYKIELKRN